MKWNWTDFGIGVGSVRNITYQKGNAGWVRKGKSIPSNPQTTAQQLVRGVTAGNASSWKILTDPQRATWSDAAALLHGHDVVGNDWTRQGFNLFIERNFNLVFCGQPAATSFVPSTVSYVATSNTIVADSGAQTITVNISPGIGALSYMVVIEASQQVSQGRNFWKDTRAIVHQPLSMVGVTNIETFYLAKFPAPLVALQKIFFVVKVYDIASGELLFTGKYSTIVT